MILALTVIHFLKLLLMKYQIQAHNMHRNFQAAIHANFLIDSDMCIKNQCENAGFIWARVVKY